MQPLFFASATVFHKPVETVSKMGQRVKGCAEILFGGVFTSEEHRLGVLVLVVITLGLLLGSSHSSLGC